MKLIKCNRPISAIVVGPDIVNFKLHGCKDKTVEVKDNTADKLLKMKGFELVTKKGGNQ